MSEGPEDVRQRSFFKTSSVGIMESIVALSASTYEALMRDYWLWIAIFGIVLAFGIYVFLVPNAIDFFTGSHHPVRPIKHAEQAAASA